jgi:hypothetical protein
MILLNGCLALNPQFETFAAEVKENRQLIEELAALANSNREAAINNIQAIEANKILIEAFADSTEKNIVNIEASLTQYLGQYVETYVTQVISG